MRRLLALALALLASVALYLGVFSVVHRPLTLGDVSRQLDAKTRYAAGLPSPKLVLFAGSNGRFSHRCEVFSEALDLPCANLSIGVGISLAFQFAEMRPLLRSGDTVYMPLEYGQYGVDRAQMEGSMHNALLVHDRRSALWALPPAEQARAWGWFDLSFLIQGGVEMALAARGVQRRSSVDSLTAQGDERGHSAAAGRTYAEFLRQARHAPIEVPERSHALDVIRAFLVEMRSRGVRVIGGLPTSPDTVPLPQAVQERLRAVYVESGQAFLVLDNRSQYPLDCFYDTLSHLNEACQREHSRQVAAALRALPLTAADGRP